MNMNRRKLAVALFAAALGASMAAPAAAQDRDRSMRFVSEFPLTGDDGGVVPNHAVKLPGPIEKMPGVVTAANPEGKTTLIEFYDLNCPFCRIASVDIEDMVSTDSNLKLVLVPYPVLGPASVAASSGRTGAGATRDAATILRLSPQGLCAARHDHRLARLPARARIRLRWTRDRYPFGQRRRRANHQGPLGSRQIARHIRHAGLHHRRCRHSRLSGPPCVASHRRRDEVLRQGHVRKHSCPQPMNRVFGTFVAPIRDSRSIPPH